jgi:hypothetical protein
MLYDFPKYRQIKTPNISTTFNVWILQLMKTYEIQPKITTKKNAHNSKRAVLQNGRLLSLLVYKFCSSPGSSPSSSPWQAGKQASNPPPLGGFFLGAYKRESVLLSCKSSCST